MQMVKGMDEDKALQILADIIDTFENGIGAAADKGGSSLKQFFEDGEPSRFAKLMGNIERNIQGPYFFGASLTVPDFVLAALTDWQDKTKLEVRMNGHEPSGGERRVRVTAVGAEGARVGVPVGAVEGPSAD